MTTFLHLVNLIACTVILVITMKVIITNGFMMHWSLRWSFIIMATGAFAGLLSAPANISQILVSVGAASTLVANRKRYLRKYTKLWHLN